jgi:ribosomal protein S18 acetylase RimI-like enzyme
VTIRDLGAGEASFLRDMLYAALDWNPGRWLPPKQLLIRLPQVSIFHKGWGRPGDTALVAEEEGRLLGLVWYRFFTEEEHGEGYVDPETPELAIAVVEGARGRGIGRSLMQAMHDRARADGIRRISLSVDADNPAKRLYSSLGYVEVEPQDELGRMVLELA